MQLFAHAYTAIIQVHQLLSLKGSERAGLLECIKNHLPSWPLQVPRRSIQSRGGQFKEFLVLSSMPTQQGGSGKGNRLSSNYLMTSGETGKVESHQEY